MRHKEMAEIFVLASMMMLVLVIRSITAQDNVKTQTREYGLYVERKDIPDVDRNDAPDFEADGTKEETDTLVHFTPEEEEMLLKLGMAEAEGEGAVGIAYVMMVVLNRVESEHFPNTIQEVIFQTNPIQFSVIKPGGRYYTTTPNQDCYEALELIKNGWDESKGALYFESSNGNESWHSRNLESVYEIGNHKFYR